MTATPQPTSSGLGRRLDRARRLASVTACDVGAAAIADAQRAASDVALAPSAWIEKTLGVRLWSLQKEIADAIMDHDRVACLTCHGIGKSFVASAILYWFVQSRTPATVITTAPTERQVKNVLWAEIRRLWGLAHRRGITLGPEPRSLEYRVSRNQYAFGFTTSQRQSANDRFQGFHAENLLVIIDEASGIDDATWQAIKGLGAGGAFKRLLLSNPLNADGPFFNAVQSDNWRVFQCGAFDTPNFAGLELANFTDGDGAWRAKAAPVEFPSLVTPQWLDDFLWDEDINGDPNHPVFVARALGRFPESDPYAIVGAADIIRAQRNEAASDIGPRQLIVDVARFGDDATVIGLRRGDVLSFLSRTTKQDLMQTVALIEHLFAERGMDKQQDAIKVDVVGVGGGVVDRLSELGYNVISIGFGESPNSERYTNVRAEAYMTLRRKIIDGEARLPDSAKLRSQLIRMKYEYRNGKVRMMPKADLKRAMGNRSPDEADVAAMAFWDRENAGAVIAAAAGFGKENNFGW